MATTIKELEKQISDLNDQVSKFQLSVENQLNNFNNRLGKSHASTSSLRDEVSTLKNNYNILVKEMSTRLEVIHKTFRKKQG